MSQHLQQEASNPKNSAWVFASAGSGKTKILTDRVLRLLLSGVAPHKILCLTFTKAAAAEMESRINSALGNWVICEDEKLKRQLEELSGQVPTIEELKKARSLFVKILDAESKIKIQTIHAFCQTLIKIFPFEAGIKPGFEVMEENQEKLLLKEAQQDLRKKALTDSNLRNLITKITATLHDESLITLSSELLDKKEKLILLKEKFFGIEGVISEIFSALKLSPNDDEEKIFADFLEKIDAKKNIQIAQDLEQSALVNNCKMAKKIRDFFANPHFKNFPLYQNAIFTTEGEIRKIPGKNISEALKAEVACLAGIALEFIEKINSLKIARDSANLLRLCNAILENYSNLKHARALLDYNDLIIETNRLLHNPQHAEWIKMKMDSGFDHILIDESQDTNQQQWNIIKALSEDFFSGLSATNKERSIFIVGDEKQSIFSFQGADANLSSEIFSYFEQKLGKNLKKIELNNSFRSTKEILTAVDTVFADSERQKAITKVGDFKAHQAIREGSGIIEIWPQIILEKEKVEESLDWKFDFSKKEEEKEAALMAKIIASKIKNWVDNSRLISAKNRPLNYGDVMILLRRRTSDFLPALIKFFHQYQIPFTSISRLKFSESLLMQDLLAAAKFVLLQEDDLNLASLLKSPFFLISEEDLLKISLQKNAQNCSLYAAIADEETKSTLTEIIQKSQQLSPFEFYYFLLFEKNYRKNFISYFGPEALEILDKFLINLNEFGKNFSHNLQSFLDFVEKVDPEISLSGADDNRVKITTVHSSKGLQAPVVMMPDCCYNLKQLPSNRGQIFWINDFPLWCSRKSGDNEAIKIFRQKRFLEISDEYLRLLYVAMTRAADELYIGGFGKNSDKDCWYEIVKKLLPQHVIESIEVAEVTLPDEAKQNAAANYINNSTQNSSKKPIPQILINPAQIKGQLIHKILEFFGKNYREDKSWLLQLAKKLIESEILLSDKEKSEIVDLSSNFLASQLFEEIFCGEVKCEFEIAKDGILQRIDLLVERESEIMIIDYKSDESLPDNIPQQYEIQLKNYKNLIEKLYPNKKVSTAILWLRFLWLQRF